MSAARQRSSKGSGSAGSEKGAQSHSGGADDVAKKQQQAAAPAKGSKAAGGRPSACSLGRALNLLFSLALVAAAAFSGWGVQQLRGQLGQLSLRHEGSARQREELARALEGVAQKVRARRWVVSLCPPANPSTGGPGGRSQSLPGLPKLCRLHCCEGRGSAWRDGAERGQAWRQGGAGARQEQKQTKGSSPGEGLRPVKTLCALGERSPGSGLLYAGSLRRCNALVHGCEKTPP